MDYVRIPLSLYIHIPFCVQKCLYCDFLSASASEEKKERYVEALLQEIDFWTEKICEKYWINTVFIGGGTPTCLEPRHLERIGKGLKKLFTAVGNEPIEFTIEANPGTITKAHVQVMREMGVNRISLGLQSAQNNELKALGRIHTYEEFVESYKLLRKNGFDNINIDLMADIPEQTLESYQDTLEKVLVLEPEHISSYSLIIEEGTPFYQMEEEGKLLIPDEEMDRKMYELTQKLLAGNGYVRYEISNYAKKGRECRHNLTYWQMGEYLGLGLGASSYFGGYRFSNVSDMTEYFKFFCDMNHISASKALEREQRNKKCAVISESATENYLERNLQNVASYHKLSKNEEMEEFVFLGLRTMKGISLAEYNKRFDVNFRELYQDILQDLLQKNLLAESENHDRIYLTEKGIDVSNIVLAEFLLEE